MSSETGQAVEVLHDRGPAAGGHRWTRASGYLIGGRLVLTVAHAVDYRQDLSDDETLLVRTIAGDELTARVLLVCGKQSHAKLALLQITDRRFAEDPLRVTFAQVNQGSTALVRDCWAVGFPGFAEAGPVLPGGGRSETWHVHGSISPGSRQRGRLLSLRVTDSPERPPTPGGSAWEGMSGAVVFAAVADGNQAVGVVSEHQPPEGQSSLTVLPIAAIEGLAAAERRQWWDHLGVTGADVLPALPEGPWPSISGTPHGRVMRTGPQRRPAEPSWVAAIHKSESDFQPIGAGVVIDERRVLTCAHVAANASELWIALPMAEDTQARRRVERIVRPETHHQMMDLAVLVLADRLPEVVTPAMLRSPKPADLAGKRWWAFGFPVGDPVGNEADGVVGAAVGYGRIRLDADSRDHVEQGFRGGGLWSPDYEAVVAVVGEANDRAITLSEAIKWFPDQHLNRLCERFPVTLAGDLALSAWGWSLSTDPEGIRHWRPRARGVSIDTESGYLFRGRTAALQTIRARLDRSSLDSRILVMTGAPGAGKSAVLGRIVTTADKAAAAELPSWDTAIRATAGSVACAVHARGKPALEIATEIARAASAALPEALEDFAPALHNALSERGGRFNVVIDALDEAAEARTVITKVIVPVAETCAEVGAQVVVGSRRRDNEGDLLTAFAAPVELVDLDSPGFFAEEDLAAYAQAALQVERLETPNPYLRNDLAAAVAAKIAELSEGNFLVAGLTARWHGLYDEAVVELSALSFTLKVDSALDEYLKRVPPVAGIPAKKLLTALAFAEAPGMPTSLWREAVLALGSGDVTARELMEFARTSAANFMMESSGPDSQNPAFRLFHQALNDALMHGREHAGMLADDERAVTESFIAFGRRTGWEHAPAYLLRSLPAHAARVEMLDDLLTDDAYLLYVDLLRLLPLANHAKTARARQRAQLLRLTSRTIINADAQARAAQLSVTEALEGLGDGYMRSSIPAPYRAVWALATPSAEQQIFEVDTGIGGVFAVCAFALGARILLAAGGPFGIKIWDPATGTQHSTLRGGHYANCVCAFTLENRTLLAAAASDGTIQIWDPATGTQDRAWESHTYLVDAMCAFTLDGRTLLATGGYDQAIQIWDPATGTRHSTLPTRTVHAMCAFTLDGRTLLATGGYPQAIQIWDPATGTQHSTLPTRSDRAICAFTLDGRTLLASDGKEAVQIWDPATGTRHSTLRGHDLDFLNDICAFTLDGRTLLASGSGVVAGSNVQIWDIATGTQYRALHTHPVKAMCAFTFDGRDLLATGDYEIVRIWDPATGTQHRAVDGHVDQVNAMCAITLDGRDLLATGDYEIVRIWDPSTGTQHTELRCDANSVDAICAFTLNGRTMLAVDQGGIIQTWDLVAGTRHRELPMAGLYAVCALTLGDRALLATGRVGGDVSLWDPATGTQHSVLEGHAAWARAVCTVTLGGRTLLATGGDDLLVRIWDPATATSVMVVPTRDPARTLAYADGVLFVGTTAGLLAVRLSPDTPPF